MLYYWFSYSNDRYQSLEIWITLISILLLKSDTAYRFVMGYIYKSYLVNANKHECRIKD